MFLGIPLFAVGFTFGGVVYLAVLFRFRSSLSRIRRRLLALAVSPIVGGPFWLWAYADREDGRSLPVYVAAVCLAYGVAVRFPRDRESRRPSSQSTVPASAR